MSEGEDEGDGVVGMLGVGPHGRGDAGMTSLAKEVEGRVAHDTVDGRTLAMMDEGGILAEVDVLGPMAPIFDEPVAATELEKALRGADLLGETGDAVADLPVLLPLLVPSPFDPKDLGQSWPVGDRQEVTGDDEVPGLGGSAMAVVDGPDAPSIEQEASLGIKDLPDRMIEGALIGFDGEKIVTTGVEDLLTEGTLTKEGISREDASLPVELLDEARRYGEFGCCLVALVRDRLLGQHQVALVREGREDVNGLLALIELASSPLGFAINGHALGPSCARSRVIDGHSRGRGEGLAIELGEEALQSRLAGRLTTGEAETLQLVPWLPLSPLGNREHRGVGTQEGADRQVEDGRQLVGDTPGPSWIGDGSKGFEQAR